MLNLVKLNISMWCCVCVLQGGIVVMCVGLHRCCLYMNVGWDIACSELGEDTTGCYVLFRCDVVLVMCLRFLLLKYLLTIVEGMCFIFVCC